MKKVFALLPIVAVIAACSSTPKDDYDKRAAAVESKREAAVEKLDAAVAGLIFYRFGFCVIERHSR